MRLTEPARIDVDTPCTGCAWSIGSVCRRFPPVWTTPQPVAEPAHPRIATPSNHGGTVMRMTQGGWSFPPAARRCGEFSGADATVDAARAPGNGHGPARSRD